MKKYIAIYKILLSQAVSYEAHYRRDTWLQLGTNILWVGMIFTIIEIIFRQTPTLLGWEKHDVYLLSVIWIIVDEIYTMAFKRNLWNIPRFVTEGMLDPYLTHPVSALFLLSTRVFLIRAFYRLLIQLGILGWLIWRFDFAVSGWRTLLVIPLMICAVVVNYSITLMLNTGSFWLYRIDKVNDLWESATTIGRYPLSVLPKTVKILTLTFLPVAFLSYIPTSTLLGRWPGYGVAYALSFTLLIFSLAVIFWNYAVKRYSSASS